MRKQTTKIDELNILDYFSEMDLPQTEIDKRIAFAMAVKEMILALFVIARAEREIEDDFDAMYFENYLVNGYTALLEDYGYKADEYITEYIQNTALEVTQNTSRHVDDKYYLSESRATLIAVNDSNTINNYTYEESFKAKGFKTKAWVTMKDSRVRHTHVMADGEEVDINEYFTVGNCKMRFPCDAINGTAEEVINCRCTCVYK